MSTKRNQAIAEAVAKLTTLQIQREIANRYEPLVEDSAYSVNGAADLNNVDLILALLDHLEEKIAERHERAEG